MSFRPAGMSETESDDSDFYSFDQNNEGRYNGKIQNNKDFESNNAYEKNYTQNEEEISETDAIDACASGSSDIIKGYLESHNIDDYLNTGWTLLLYAATAANVEIIENLLSCGADPNKHKDGYTPLMALCNSHCKSEERSLKCLRLLIDANATVNAYNNQSETALMFACKSQTLSFVSELLKHVKEIDFRDTSGRTALMYAVLENRVEIIKLLVENGADVTSVDRNNSSSIDIAYQKGYTEVLHLLDPNHEETIEEFEKLAMPTWSDMFSTIKGSNQEIDFDITLMLSGMGLESYRKCFVGMDLKSFLQQTEKDLISVGVDISAQRQQFIQNLHKFHKRKWACKSVGSIDKSMPYTVYDALVTLNTVKKHTGIINSTFGYMKLCLTAGKDTNQYFDKEKLLEFQEELERMKQVVNKFQSEIVKLNVVTAKMCKENRIDDPPYYIGRKRDKSNLLWYLSSAIIIGMCISKATWVQVQTSSFVEKMQFYLK